MTEKDVYASYGRMVDIYCTDGKQVSGFFCVFTPSYDNDPQVAEVTLETPHGLVGIPVPEIVRIEAKE